MFKNIFDLVDSVGEIFDNSIISGGDVSQRKILIYVDFPDDSNITHSSQHNIFRSYVKREEYNEYLPFGFDINPTPDDNDLIIYNIFDPDGNVEKIRYSADNMDLIRKKLQPLKTLGDTYDNDYSNSWNPGLEDKPTAVKKEEPIEDDSICSIM